MRDALEAFAHATGKNLATPDCAVIAVAGSVEAHSDDVLVPSATLRQHRSDVGAMMLHGALFRRGDLRGMYRRSVLRMRVVNEQQFVRINLIHRKQILDGFAEGAKRLVMIQVSNVLAYEGLAIHDKCNGVLEVRAECKNGTVGWKCGSGAGGESSRSAKN